MNRRIFVTGLLLALAGCATTPRVNYDADPAANFASYRSYSWASINVPQGMNPLLFQRVKASIDTALAARGYSQANPGTIKATVLIETLPSAFEMDEIIYELREHMAGLNCGRWDYIFSFIKKLARNKAFVLPDRSQVVMTKAFLRAYSLLLIKTCHRRGAFAMGGMAAQIPVATPKLTKSESESSSAPKREVPLSIRASLPSTPSSAAAIRMQIVAVSSLPSTTSRIAVRPRQSASRVMTLGAMSLNGIGLKRARLVSTRSGSKGGKRSLMPAGIRGFQAAG